MWNSGKGSLEDSDFCGSDRRSSGYLGESIEFRCVFHIGIVRCYLFWNLWCYIARCGRTSAKRNMGTDTEENTDEMNR